MPVSIVVGGQFGSEGKGKVALEIVRRADGRSTVVRVGGPNSGHTAYDRHGRRWALRQMPAACVDLNVDVVFPAGSYIDIELLRSEIDALSFPEDRIHIHPFANIITDQHRAWEQSSNLTGRIGSTGSGVGAAVMASVARTAENFPLVAVHAQFQGQLEPMIRDTSTVLDDILRRGDRVVIEGSQGFGLSLLDGGIWPKATARSTTAAAALSEAGIGIAHVDDVVLVLRSFPIRVAGESGPLSRETTWQRIAERTGRSDDIREYTTVTKKLRRVGEFDVELARKAIMVNAPHRLVLNHLDYVGPAEELNLQSGAARRFVTDVEAWIGRPVSWLGFDPYSVVDRTRMFA
ncbi:adenylosuccinate synthetase [Jiella pacifica]|uniref:Adenylosuccinate synthetase n=1 Tax=Jiella pacifica TaxID=2696469 RepID=A0A6N9T7R7_9HYPH|nr:adenylosuccinate synthetase [Jiella pacifica]NDW07464.1 adenylosuccinate synthetase [Jiella pacifica]